MVVSVNKSMLQSLITVSYKPDNASTIKEASTVIFGFKQLSLGSNSNLWVQTVIFDF